MFHKVLNKVSYRTRLESSNFYVFSKYIYTYIYNKDSSILYKDFENTKDTNTNVDCRQ